MEDLEDFHEPRVSADGNVVLQYSRHGHYRDVVARVSSRQQQLPQPRLHHQEEGAVYTDTDAGRFGKQGRRSKSRPRVQSPTENSGIVAHNFVSFYFTIVPDNISY